MALQNGSVWGHFQDHMPLVHETPLKNHSVAPI